MKPTTDATVLDNVLLATRQHTSALDGLQSALVVTCSASTITFRLPGFSSQAGFSCPLPPGWPGPPDPLPAGTPLLVAFVRNNFDGTTDVWALAYR